ncbi:MAG: hypothetical protein ACQEQY_05890 [Halobacteriota archaeon]
MSDDRDACRPGRVDREGSCETDRDDHPSWAVFDRRDDDPSQPSRDRRDDRDENRPVPGQTS